MKLEVGRIDGGVVTLLKVKVMEEGDCATVMGMVVVTTLDTLLAIEALFITLPIIMNEFTSWERSKVDGKVMRMWSFTCRIFVVVNFRVLTVEVETLLETVV
jgi:hypothetical protein